MYPHNILKSSSLKIVISNFITMVICFILIGLVAGFFVHKEFDKFVDRSILSTKAVLAESYNAGQKEGLLKLLSSYAKIVSNEDQIFYVVDVNNSKMVGNIETDYRQLGWDNIPPSMLGIDDEFPYRVYGFKIEDLYILIGHSRELTDELAEILLAVLGYGSLIILAIVLIGGFVTTLQTRKQIKQIGATLDIIAQGNLEKRIPLSGHHDDIDHLSYQINRFLRQLSAMFHTVKQVSSDIAHDLKTPVNRLNVYIEAAMGEITTDKAATPFLEKAHAEMIAMNETFEALLRISQIEAGARKSRFMNVDLRSVLEPVIDAYQPVAEDQGYIFQTEGLDLSAVLPVWGDRELLMQMFANIIENAMRHCPKGALLQLSSARSGKQASISVCDNGAGIPEQERKNVLQRLYRLEKSRTTPGSGLGLSLVKAIADLHDVPFKLEDNKPGLCVTFYFKVL